MFDFMDNHPMLILGIIFGGIIVFYLVKYLIDSKKGINSQARYKVLEILKRVIPVEEKYVPVYAYWVQGTRRISYGKYYAMGITDDRLYIVPLHIAGEEIGYKGSFVITRDSLGKIDSGKPGGGMRFVSLYDKNQKEIFKFIVDPKNTKLDRAYPVNITQTEEFHAFFAKLDEWKFKETTTDVKFEKAAPQNAVKLENQNGVIENCSRQDIEEYLRIMFDDREQFITLSVPDARYGIRFVQACRVDKGIDVELGLEEDNQTRLICKICSENECREVFCEFFDTLNVFDRKGYEPIRIKSGP